MLSPEERRTLIKLGMEKTAKVYKEAEDIAKLGYWNLTGNRLYYAVFHMARTLLLDKGIEAHTHAGVIHLIGKYFIATGLLVLRQTILPIVRITSSWRLRRQVRRNRRGGSTIFW